MKVSDIAGVVLLLSEDDNHDRGREPAQIVPYGPQAIWREGDRIRRQDGTGYGDRVSDEDIRKHIADNGDDRLFVAFAEAVLAIRALERVV